MQILICCIIIEPIIKLTYNYNNVAIAINPYLTGDKIINNKCKYINNIDSNISFTYLPNINITINYLI